MSVMGWWVRSGTKSASGHGNAAAGWLATAALRAPDRSREGKTRAGHTDSIANRVAPPGSRASGSFARLTLA
jgi:hypothetical protein